MRVAFTFVWTEDELTMEVTEPGLRNGSLHVESCHEAQDLHSCESLQRVTGHGYKVGFCRTLHLAFIFPRASQV